MSVNAWLMVGILVTMFVFLAWGRFPAWLVFMGTLTAVMTLKLAPPEALLTGFSNTGVMTVAALFPVAAGMYASGAISLLSQRLVGRPESLASAQIRIFPPMALGSAVLNNTPMVAMMIPVVRSSSARHRFGRFQDIHGAQFRGNPGREHDPDRLVGKPDHRRSGVERFGTRGTEGNGSPGDFRSHLDRHAGNSGRLGLHDSAGNPSLAGPDTSG